jgi:hypothetical protein
MPTFYIHWNSGFGDSVEEIEANTETEANDYAYVAWREEAESQASYGVISKEEYEQLL